MGLIDKSKLNRKIFLIRHAHRDTSGGRSIDNGLSSKGKEQSLRLFEFYRSRFGKADCLLMSSPKRRCIETLEPIAHYLKKQIEESDLLLEEAEEKQSKTRFQHRVKQFCIGWLETGPAMTLVCSHGDWIPAVIKELVGVEIALKKGSWVELEETSEGLVISDSL